ncbi:YdcF family protein [Candidatus Woesearchaeota archaeon]|nr:YdcF family protein [Candidatus Woesearchaeota archaeon]
MKYDAIIVLGGGLDEKGCIPQIVKLRVDRAVELYKKSFAPRIIMSGKWSINTTKTFLLTEAEAMEQYAVSCGVCRDDVLTEKESQDTLGNAYLTKINFLKPAKWRNIVVITTDFHMPRTKFLFNKVFGEDYKIRFVGVPSGFSAEKIKNYKKLEKEKLAFYRTYFKFGSRFFDFDRD